MAENVAMQNFTMNTLKGMGTGGSLGASNGIQTAVLTDKDYQSELQSKFTSPLFAWYPDKFFQGMQGFVQSIELNHFFGQLQPPVTPIGGDQKVANVLGKR